MSLGLVALINRDLRFSGSRLSEELELHPPVLTELPWLFFLFGAYAQRPPDHRHIL